MEERGEGERRVLLPTVGRRGPRSASFVGAIQGYLAQKKLQGYLAHKKHRGYAWGRAVLKTRVEEKGAESVVYSWK